MSSIRLLMLGLSIAGVLAMSACGDDPVTTGEPIEVDTYFNLNVDGAPVQINTNANTYTNSAGTKYGISEFRFIISDVKLHTDEGRAVTIKNVHFYDINDASTQTIHSSSLPHANYTSVSFNFGLSTSENIRNKYPAIPAIMVWPTALGDELGYHYMQLSGNFESGPGTTAGYETHTGPRHLDGTNPAFPGVVDITAYDFSFPITASFTPAHIHEGGHGQLQISFNLNGWYLDHTPVDGNDTRYDFKALSNQTIMGNLDAQGKLQTNGPGCFSATLVAHGGHDH